MKRTSVRRAALATASLAALGMAAAVSAQAAPAATVSPKSADSAAPPVPPAAVPATTQTGEAAPSADGASAAADPATTPTPRQRPADLEAAAEASPKLRPAAAQADPAAISTFTLTDLDRRELRSLRGIGDFVPNMVETTAPGIGSANVYTIRGLGNAETAPGFSPMVGTFVDGVYLAPASANNFGLFDLDRVDVRRGPQSVLLGRDTAAGAVDVTLRQPGDVLAGYIEGGYGAYSLGEVRASVDIPLGQMLSLKLSGYHQSDEGYVRDRVTRQRNNDSDVVGLRAAARLQLTDRLSWNTSIAYMRDDAENLLNFTCDPVQPALCNGRFASTGLLTYYNATNPSPLAGLGVTGRKANFGLQNYTNTWLYTSNIEWHASDALKLNLITGVVDFRQRYALEFADGRAGLPVPGQALPSAAGYPVGYVRANDSGTREFSQDVRFSGSILNGGLEYVAGATYYQQHDRADVADAVNRGGPGAGTPVLLADRRVYSDTRSVAGYAQLDVHPTTALTISGGVRYTDEQLNLAIADNRARCAVVLTTDCFTGANLLTTGGAVIPAMLNTHQWSPHVSLTYQLPDALLFVSATRGFQSGGWETRSLTPGGLLPYAPEQVWTYEAGVKSELFDQRLRANLRGFWVEAGNDQVPTATVAAGVPVYATQNVGLRSRGAELELTAKPVAHVGVFADLGYQHATYRNGALPLVTQGVRPVRSPEVTASAGASYDYAIPAAGIILEPTANISYRSSTDIESATLLGVPATRVGGYALVNAALIMKTDDNNWTLSVECTNCLDKAAGQSALLGYTYLNEPRTWLVRARRVF